MASTRTHNDPARAVDPRGEKWAVLWVATLASFLTPYMASSINIALPALGRDLDMGTVALGWVQTAYLLAGAVMLVPLGRLADIRGRRRMFSAGMAAYTLASLLLVFAWSPTSLIVLRVIQGAAGAAIFGPGVAMIISVFPPGERGRALGINVSAVYLGLSLGPFLGGVLTEHFGWRSIFLSNVPLGLLVLALIAARVRGEWAEAAGEGFDLGGSLLYCVGLVALMLGFSRMPSAAGVWMAAAGGAVLAFFVSWELQARYPVLEVNLFRHNRVFAFSNLAALIHYSATFAIAFLLSLYLQYVKGMSPQEAGLVLMAQPAVMSLLSPAAGRLSDSVQPRLVASAGMTLTAAGLFALAFLNGREPTWGLVGVLLGIGLGYALFSSPNTSAVMGSVRRRHLGVASATVGTMRLLGQMVSMAISMLVFAVFLGRVGNAAENLPAFIRSVRVAFTVFGLLGVAGIMASLARGREGGGGAEETGGEVHEDNGQARGAGGHGGPAAAAGGGHAG